MCRRASLLGASSLLGLLSPYACGALLALSSPRANGGREDTRARWSFRDAAVSRTGDTAMLFRSSPGGGRFMTFVDFRQRTERLVEGLQPWGYGAWSPDGTHFATNSWPVPGRPRAVLVDAGTLRWVPLGPPVSSMWSPAWAPDGRKLLLSVATEDPQRLFTVYLARPGSEEATLLGEGSTVACVNPYWRGQWLVSRREPGAARDRDDPRRLRRFYALAGVGEAEEVLPEHITDSIVVSPDGRRGVAVCLSPQEPSRSVPIEDLPAGPIWTWPGPLPGGADIPPQGVDVARLSPGDQAAVRGLFPPIPCELYVLSRPNDHSPRRILQAPDCGCVWVRWSYASDRLVATLGAPMDAQELPVVLVDPESGAQTPLQLADGMPLTGTQPTWADGDSRIVYLRGNRWQGREVWAYDLRTKRSERVYPFEER